MSSAAPNVNHYWADLIVEELVRQGVRCFCIAPGSRSTPLAMAVARHEQAEAIVHFDERGTAFFALGYGRATGRPAAWITTSGTALANALPAVVEADAEAIPLLLLTADRPPELRATGANQTIRQPQLYGDHVRWRFDMPPPTDALDLAFVLSTVDHAFYHATGLHPGPVHLNLMFREPLAPTPTPFAPPTGTLTDWAEQDTPFTTHLPTAPVTDTAALADALHGIERGLLVAGRLDTDAEREAAVALAEALGWPLLPDVTSGLRLGATSGTVVPFYDLMLEAEGFRRAYAPEAVVHIGGRYVSKTLLQYLGATRPRLFATVRATPNRIDPNHQVTHAVQAAVAPFCQALAATLTPPTMPSRWMRTWRAATSEVERRARTFFTDHEALSEPGVARILARELPEGHALVLASSMPIRDVDRFAPPDGAAVPVIANRGASGIDGTVATAAGYAYGSGRPTTLLLGDLALLHDLNSLALLARLPVPLTIVAINNDGGGIFSFLPVADTAEAATFEQLFGTPHGLAFRHAAALFGLDYAHPDTPSAFDDAYEEALASEHPSLIEVRTDRAANHALHAEAATYILASLT